MGVDQGTAARSAKDNPTNGSDKLKYSRSIRSYGEEFHTENIHKVLNKAIERTIMKKIEEIIPKISKTKSIKKAVRFERRENRTIEPICISTLDSISENEYDAINV